MRTTDIMLDLETMGTGSNAAILAIGAVHFDYVSGVMGDEFYQRVNLDSCIQLGLTVDADTILWWLRQDDGARLEICRPAGPIKTVLEVFKSWMGDGKIIWGNGANFDNVILANAYESAGINRPWSPFSDRCYRTIKNLHPHIRIVKDGIAHNALDDAVNQARHLMEI